ncbi:MAG: hypothetical protein GY725_06100 [bacterium]|nr:hypothetical protein [bacterium]
MLRSIALRVSLVVVVLCATSLLGCTHTITHGVHFGPDDLENPPPPALQIHSDVISQRRCRPQALKSIRIVHVTKMKSDELAAFRSSNTSAGKTTETQGAAPMEGAPGPAPSALVQAQVESIAAALSERGLVVAPDGKLRLELEFGSVAMDVSGHVDDPEIRTLYMHFYQLALMRGKDRPVWLATAISNQMLSESPAAEGEAVLGLLERMREELLGRFCRSEHLEVRLEG